MLLSLKDPLSDCYKFLDLEAYMILYCVVDNNKLSQSSCWQKLYFRDENMTNHPTDINTAVDKPLVLSSVEIDELLSMRPIANLASLDDDGSIHLMPMWFLRSSIVLIKW